MKEMQNWLKENLTEVWVDCKPFELTILFVASLNEGSKQSLATNPRIWSRRWRRWWGPLQGTPWRRPAQASGSGSSLPLQLSAVLLNKLILNMYVYLQIFFYFNKIGWFSAVLCHLKERRKKSGFIAATLYTHYSLPLRTSVSGEVKRSGAVSWWKSN